MTSRLHTARLLVFCFVALAITSCATINSRSGLHLSNSGSVGDTFSCEIEHPIRYGTNAVVRLESVAISLSLSPLEKRRILFTGPGVPFPLPVIPWPPGIYSALFSKGVKHDADPVEVTVHFLTWIQGIKKYRGERHYTFRPHEVTLESNGKKYSPVSVDVSSDTYRGYTTDDINVFHNGCFEWKGDVLAVQTKIGSNCSDVYVKLRFDAIAGDIGEGVLKLGEVTLNDQPVSGLDSRIERRTRRYLWWLYSINS